MVDEDKNPTCLPQVEIDRRLAALPRWAHSGGGLEATWVFHDFIEAVGFVNRIAAVAERAQHHPDITIRWNKVSLSLVTHDAGGITTHDFDLAHQIEQL